MNTLNVARRLSLCVLLALAAGPLLAQSSAKESGLRFEISFPSAMSPTPLDGRVYIILSKDGTHEPRFQISPEISTQEIFGVDVDGLAPGAAAIIDRSALGYPVENLEQIPPGDYFVQGFINIYETFHLASGYTVKLPPDHGEGQRWNFKPGNLYSAPQQVHIDPQAGSVVRVSLTQKIPPIPPVADTKYVKHIKIQSQLLSKFWGRPTDLGAIVILPEGWEEHPNARYPLLIQQNHYGKTWYWPVQFRSVPPTADLKGNDRDMAVYSYQFYQDWTSGRLPHMILLAIQHPNPYYDDSYAVNSANLGPYGDAIVQELIPEVERRFRALGQPWARAMYGGSTGGWETLAMQVFYPDFFNGAWVFCPDPIDFRAFEAVDIYKATNAYWEDGPWLHPPYPALRTPDDVILATMESYNECELAIGTHLRSGEQFAIWQAVFGPVGADGYPRPLYDARTGVIDPEVLARALRPERYSSAQLAHAGAKVGRQTPLHGRHARRLLPGWRRAPHAEVS
jgi:enterochelin esterase-like enzyme